MQTPSASTITLLVLLPLLAWRMVSRFRRMVGRQRLSRVRPWITLAIFPLLIALLALASLRHPERLAALAAALAAGAALGVFGLRKTVFEPTPTGLYYTPNAHLGIALSSLFALRVVYRLAEVYVLAPERAYSGQEFARSPLTLAVFGLLAGYYISYAIGLVRWRHALLARRDARLRDQAAAATATAAPPAALQLRPATAADRALCYRITEDAMRGYVEQTWGHWNDDEQRAKHEANFTPETHRIIVVEGMHEAGLVAVEELPTHRWLVKLYLLAAWRGRGVGSAVLRGVIDDARAAGGKPVKLRVLRVNTAAQRLYARHGFVVEEETPERLFMNCATERQPPAASGPATSDMM